MYSFRLAFRKFLSCFAKINDSHILLKKALKKGSVKIDLLNFVLVIIYSNMKNALTVELELIKKDLSTLNCPPTEQSILPNRTMQLKKKRSQLAKKKVINIIIERSHTFDHLAKIIGSWLECLAIFTIS